MHLDTPAWGPLKPAGHGRHAHAPLAGANMPVGHGAQPAARQPGANAPGAHSWQAPDVAFAKLPGAQGVQLYRLSPGAVPAGQSLHAHATPPASLTCEALQSAAWLPEHPGVGNAAGRLGRAGSSGRLGGSGGAEMLRQTGWQAPQKSGRHSCGGGRRKYDRRPGG
jgi:hypothetical protein